LGGGSWAGDFVRWILGGVAPFDVTEDRLFQRRDESWKGMASAVPSYSR